MRDVPRKWILLPSIVKGAVAVPYTEPRGKSIRKVASRLPAASLPTIVTDPRPKGVPLMVP